MADTVKVTFELGRGEALALAQFVKRTSHSDCAEKATTEDEAYRMMDGVNEVMKGLAEAGFNPR